MELVSAPVLPPAPPKRRSTAAAARTEAFSVQLVRDGDLAAHREAWEALVKQVLEPNCFYNFLLQIRGSKRIHQFDPRDRTIVTEKDLERFYGGAHRNMTFREEFRAKAWVFELQPGQGLYFPVTAPHFVENGSSVSVSFSITFRTPDLEQRSIVHNVNAYLRGRGWRPKPAGQHPWRDRLKATSYRLWRKARGLLGRPVS